MERTIQLTQKTQNPMELKITIPLKDMYSIFEVKGSREDIEQIIVVAGITVAALLILKWIFSG